MLSPSGQIRTRFLTIWSGSSFFLEVEIRVRFFLRVLSGSGFFTRVGSGSGFLKGRILHYFFLVGGIRIRSFSSRIRNSGMMNILNPGSDLLLLNFFARKRSKGNVESSHFTCHKLFILIISFFELNYFLHHFKNVLKIYHFCTICTKVSKLDLPPPPNFFYNLKFCIRIYCIV